MTETVLKLSSIADAPARIGHPTSRWRMLWNRLTQSRFTSFSSFTVRIGVTGVHLIALSAILFRPRAIDIGLFVFFYFVTGFGVTVGFHRLLAHKGFESSPWLAGILAFLGTASFQGGPLWWVGVHRKHHQASDKEGDPHSPIESFVHGHIGWMYKRDGIRTWPNLVKDLSRSRFLVFLDSGPGALIPWLSVLVVCFLIGGWRGAIWGGFVRTVFVWHATWCVNSVCHRMGSKPHKMRENSGNVWWVGLWALGEGWHNNHHAHPRAAIHNYHWWEIDLSAYVLLVCERLGFVSNIIRAGKNSPNSET